MAEILMITGVAGAEHCAAVLAKQFRMSVDTVSNRREAISLMRRREYLVVVVDESMLEAGVELGEERADTLFKHSGLAIQVEVNFAISGCGRLVRAVRVALNLRECAKETARRAAIAALQSELRATVAGLLLHSQLAMAEPALSSQISSHLGMVVDLAEKVRQRLEEAGTQALTALPSPLSPPRPVLQPALAAEGGHNLGCGAHAVRNARD